MLGRVGGEVGVQKTTGNTAISCCQQQTFRPQHNFQLTQTRSIAHVRRHQPLGGTAPSRVHHHLVDKTRGSSAMSLIDELGPKAQTTTYRTLPPVSWSGQKRNTKSGHTAIDAKRLGGGPQNRGKYFIGRYSPTCPDHPWVKCQ